MTVYLSQGIDYLGFLNAKLRDLRGWSTLLNELIQNADDARGTARLKIDVTDDALVVENDGLFSDCGAAGEDACRLDTVGDGRRCCDFHAFRRVAGGHKRVEEGTTGAFGIGFVSVYQVTDGPTLRSGNWYWKLFPDAEERRRIEGMYTAERFPGTCFELPWARENTQLRVRLGLEPVPTDIVERMVPDLQSALVLAAPFLKHLTTLELRKRGQEVVLVRCEHDTAGQIVIRVGGETRLWKRLGADFNAEAGQLRQRHGTRIEEKRKGVVTIAVPMEPRKAPGLLYATLPTEHEIALPLLINADFFPSSDRKRILFDADYQGEWNRAAISAAANGVAGALEDLRDTLAPRELWRLLEAAKSLQREDQSGRTDKVFAGFWEKLAPRVRTGMFVRTSAGSWATPMEARLLQSEKEEGAIVPLLEHLGLAIVHTELQSFANLLRDSDVGVKLLALDDVSSSFSRAGLDRVREEKDIPDWLRKAENRRQLGIVAARLLERVAKDTRPATQDRFKACTVARTAEGQYASPATLRVADEETRALFAKLTRSDLWLDPDEPEEVARWVPPFTCNDAVSILSDTGVARIELMAREDAKWLGTLIGWFAGRRERIVADATLGSRLRALRIWPAGGALESLDELSVPGNFDDPLGLAKVINRSISSRHRAFLTQDLGATELILRTYLLDHVPRAFEAGPQPTPETRRALMNLTATHLGQVVGDHEILRALGGLPLVECTDGEFRSARVAYFKSELVTTVLGESAPIAKLPEASAAAMHDLLKALGVRETPRANDILERTDGLTATAPDAQTSGKIRDLFDGLTRCWGNLADDEKEGLNELRTRTWLPAEGKGEWFAPAGVYATFQKFLFASQGTFLGVPQPVQQRGASVLDFFDVRTTPPVSLVIRHLLHCAQARSDINPEVYEFLGRHANQPEINQLLGKECLRLDGGRYIRPGEAFWTSHQFGHYRVRLSDNCGGSRRSSPSSECAMHPSRAMQQPCSRKSPRSMPITVSSLQRTEM